MFVAIAASNYVAHNYTVVAIMTCHNIIVISLARLFKDVYTAPSSRAKSHIIMVIYHALLMMYIMSNSHA